MADIFVANFICILLCIFSLMQSQRTHTEPIHMETKVYFICWVTYLSTGSIILAWIFVSKYYFALSNQILSFLLTTHQAVKLMVISPGEEQLHLVVRSKLHTEFMWYIYVILYIGPFSHLWGSLKRKWSVVNGN